MSLQRRRGAIAGARSVAAGSPVTGDIASTLPALTQAATGSVEVRADIAATLPALEQAATGTVLVGGAVTADIAATLPALTQAATGSVEVRADIAATLPALTQAVAATIGFGGPSAIADLQAWYDADALTGFSDGDPVGSWTDLSGNSLNATASLSNRPIYKTAILNGKPIVRFDGTDDGLITPIITRSGTKTVFLVAKHATGSSASFQMAIGGNNTTASFSESVHYLGTSNASQLFTFAGTLLNGPSTTSSWVRVTAVHNGGSGTLDVSGSSTSGSIGARQAALFTLGHARRGTAGTRESFWPGDIAEAIIYDRVLSSSEISDVESYLSTKWGV